MSEKKIPLRSCVVCKEPKTKAELLRVVYNKMGECSIDTTGRAQGRGAYICRRVGCIDKAIKTRVFNKVFRADIPQTVYDELRSYRDE